jgi:hypothetical protein
MAAAAVEASDLLDHQKRQAWVEAVVAAMEVFKARQPTAPTDSVAAVAD